jgi:hypothetical protein
MAMFDNKPEETKYIYTDVSVPFPCMRGKRRWSGHILAKEVFMSSLGSRIILCGTLSVGLALSLAFTMYAQQTKASAPKATQSGDENGDTRAFLWQNGIMTDVNNLIPASSDLQLVTAFQINSRGQINGTAIQKSTGQTRAYLATSTNGGTAHLSPRITLPNNVRKLLRQRLAIRFRVPGLAIEPTN